MIQNITIDQGQIRSSPRYGLSTPYRLTMEQCWMVPPIHHVLVYMGDLHLFLPEFVYPGCCYFVNGAIIFINDVLTEHGGLPYIYHLADSLIFYVGKWRGLF